ncbi:hypothetical protein HYH03_010837 [Edaphochlamys debaryana]|uniref:Uncharacterized protein n=1 Tax=Edaphochlamys debaryana TaxID=47281 RepID=A0A835XUX3_9CHLO|nr:hypothetical protein HYH03_010837 [Edaphochlamys debaryana]|eukprot:KAG2490668.1 hypothetical protein HYH03_010837 [Edaphochlamys debaryana]
MSSSGPGWLYIVQTQSDIDARNGVTTSELEASRLAYGAGAVPIFMMAVTNAEAARASMVSDMKSGNFAAQFVYHEENTGEFVSGSNDRRIATTKGTWSRCGGLRETWGLWGRGH